MKTELLEARLLAGLMGICFLLAMYFLNKSLDELEFFKIERTLEHAVMKKKLDRCEGYHEYLKGMEKR